MPISIYIFLLMQLCLVGYIDIKVKKIHNYWALINLFVYLILLFVFPEYYIFGLKSFVFPLAFLFVGYLLFLLKIMGAGDSKYLFSFYFLIPTEVQEEAFKCLAYTTVFVGLFLLTFTVVSNFTKVLNAVKYMQVNTIKEIFGSKFSYAPVIFVSWCWFGYVQYV